MTTNPSPPSPERGGPAGPPPVPVARREPLSRLLDLLGTVSSIALTTHVNADGDGAGSETALAAWLAGRGIRVRILNPTPFPAEFRFLLPDPFMAPEPGSAEAEGEAGRAELLFVVDTAEPRRIGRLEKQLSRARVAVLDHHPPTEGGIPGTGLLDPEAAATGELVYDLLLLAGERGAGPPVPWPGPVLEGIYTALVTDTGSFRYANTSPRVHRITADLLERGIDPEALYRHIFANATPDQLRLLGLALERLERDPELPLTWTTVPWSIAAEVGATAGDFEGIIEHTRSVSGTEVAILFREVADGSTKVSLRSNGAADVNAIARLFGGGGHIKASGAVVGAPLAEASRRVLVAAREALRAVAGEDA